ncbi:MAG TPA: GIY-YIG nuclease family protein [Bacteroidia bacterium]|nr:GIY-YIG nuclease family protein [Bacteroidia bacterium]
MFEVYILYSEKSQLYYVGQTSDLAQRLLQHNGTATNNYTSKHRPWVLKAAITVADIKSALILERYIKSQKRKAFIALVIEKQNDKDFISWLFDKSSIIKQG